jgi:hypothetical protein
VCVGGWVGGGGVSPSPWLLHLHGSQELHSLQPLDLESSFTHMHPFMFFLMTCLSEFTEKGPDLGMLAVAVLCASRNSITCHVGIYNTKVREKCKQ